jgi:hypothetical protein
MPFGLTRHADAVATAAGSHAEKLSKRYKPPLLAPRPTPPLPTELPPEIAERRASAIAEIRKSAYRAIAKTDAQDLAEFCTSFQPGNPHDWLARHRAIHREARELVQKHRREIRAMARRLFVEGEVEIPGDPADNAFFVGQVT